jgi:hypothetical protein
MGRLWIGFTHELREDGHAREYERRRRHSPVCPSLLDEAEGALALGQWLLRLGWPEPCGSPRPGKNTSPWRASFEASHDNTAHTVQLVHTSYGDVRRPPPSATFSPVIMLPSSLRRFEKYDFCFCVLFSNFLYDPFHKTVGDFRMVQPKFDQVYSK